MARKIEVNDPTSLPNTRSGAKGVGSSLYFTGKECVNGHVSARRTKDGSCIECTRMRSNAVNAADPQQNRARANAYYWKNKETINAKTRDERAKDPEKFRAAERRRTRDKSIARAYRARRLIECGDEIRARDRERYYANKEAYYARNQTRRARRKGSDGRHTKEDIAGILARQKFKCAECGVSVKKRASRHTDHIIPLSLGGTNWPSNIQILCARCNLMKGAKHPLDFAQERGRLV